MLTRTAAKNAQSLAFEMLTRALLIYFFMSAANFHPYPIWGRFAQEGGVPIRGNTEIGLFSQRNSEKCIYFGALRKTGMLSDTEILYFGGQNTAKFQSYGH